ALHLICMKIEFDIGKDRSNREKHGVSLARAAEMLMDVQAVFTDTRFNYGECRYVAYGPVDGRLHCLVYTRPDAKTVRAVSLRKANKREVKRHG
ncbi:MAG: BrnT family toxin, partial [Methylocella sp.]